MISKIIRVLYRRFPVKFAEILCEEFLADIPKKVSEPAITLLAEQKETIEKWLNYSAYQVQRRAVGDVRRADFYLGILMNIKIMLRILESKSSKKTYKKDFGEMKTMDEYKKELEKSLEGVDKFKKRSKVESVDK